MSHLMRLPLYLLAHNTKQPPEPKQNKKVFRHSNGKLFPVAAFSLAHMFLLLLLPRMKVRLGRGATLSSLFNPSMGAKMKGFFKGFKYISQIFVYKEHEMEIGYPTDVRHVAHIGWDGSSMNAPGWMSEFRTASDFSTASLSNLERSRETSWTSQDFEQARGLHAPAAAIFTTAALHPADIPKAPKKTKRKKKARPSSPTSSRASSYATALEGAEELPGETRVI